MSENEEMCAMWRGLNRDLTTALENRNAELTRLRAELESVKAENKKQWDAISQALDALSADGCHCASCERCKQHNAKIILTEATR